MPGLRLSQLADLLEEEFALYKAEILSEQVDIRRAWLIEWIAAFIPEAVPKGFEQKLADFVLEMRKLRDFHHRFWYLLLSLDAALFCLTESTEWLENIIVNFDHHNSALRRQAHIAASVIAPRLSIYEPEYQERTRSNLENHHFFNDKPLLVFACGKGDAEEKRALLQDWRDSVDRLSNDDPQVLDALIAGECVTNPLLYYLNRMQQYAFLRLACTKPRREGSVRQTTAFHPSDGNAGRQLAMRDPAAEPTGLFEIIEGRLSEHPMMQVYVRLEKTATSATPS